MSKLYTAGYKQGFKAGKKKLGGAWWKNPTLMAAAIRKELKHVYKQEIARGVRNPDGSVKK